jgi:hypothetical protein
VPPPPHFSPLRAQSASGADVVVNYLPPGYNSFYDETCYAWPAQGIAAFEYAASIWESLIVSDVEIEVDACWAQFSSPYILGYSFAVDYEHDFPNAPQADTWYPISLANALQGTDMAPSRADMFVAYGRDFNWYFGTDGNTPGGRTDFVSVVLHEICHGLGFSGSMQAGYYNGSMVGAWGYGIPPLPDAYDRFVENGAGQSVLNTSLFPNYSTALYAQLTGNDLYFNGPNAWAGYGGQRPKIYAPSSWSQGSSYAHLDYDTFNDTPHALMTYAISQGESSHDPGSVTMGILQDVGWTTYDAMPEVTGITPGSGFNSGVVHITNLAGANFQTGATAHLERAGEADIVGTNVTVVGEDQITVDFDLLGAAVGLWDVVVTNPDGASAPLAGGFEVQPSPTAPVVNSISPATGVNTETVPVEIVGTNFITTDTTLVELRQGTHSLQATGVNVTTTNRILATLDLHGALAGPWDLVVTNPSGESGVLQDGFTVEAAYQIYLPLASKGHTSLAR